ncbi:MAG: ArsA family ATPase [Bacillota bacterium]|nr:ArsA family ATPase [Bacillota bacterium]
MLRYVFFSGKGGVGKTSMACATAMHYARCGEKTLIVTTDPAANLSDVFEQRIGHRITPVDGIPGLFAMEIDPDIATREYIEHAIEPMREVFDGETLSVVQEQLSGPCTVEMAAFEKFIDFMGETGYGKIIFDTAPTGHTLRLLELPVEWSRHIEESARGSGQTCMGPVGLIIDNKRKFDEAMAKLKDRSLTDFVFVMHAEESSLSETIRSMDELRAIGINTSRIIINSLIPAAEAVHPFFRAKAEAQNAVVKKAEAVFAGLPIEKIELLDDEIKGINMIEKCAERLFKGGACNEKY